MPRWQVVLLANAVGMVLALASYDIFGSLGAAVFCCVCFLAAFAVVSIMINRRQQ